MLAFSYVGRGVEDVDLLLTVSSDEWCGRGVDEKVVAQNAAISSKSASGVCAVPRL